MTPDHADEHPPVHTVTGSPHRSAAHAARPALPRRALLIAAAAAVLVGGVAAVVSQRSGSVPSAPGSAERITVPPRVTPTTGAGGGVGAR